MISKYAISVYYRKLFTSFWDSLFTSCVGIFSLRNQSLGKKEEGLPGQRKEKGMQEKGISFPIAERIEPECRKLEAVGLRLEDLT